MNTAFVQQQYDDFYGDGIEHYWWHVARNRIILDEIERIPLINPRVLDVGCGRGIAVKYLRDRGIACDGVELAATRPLPEVGAHIRYGTNAIDLPVDERKTYEVLLLLDVVEHLPEPATFIASLLDAFQCVTHLVITVPACPELWSNFDVHFGHYRRYTAESLRELAHEARLDLVHQSYFFHTAYVPARLLTARRKDRSTHVEPPRGWMKAIHRVIGAMMLLDYRIVPHSVRGMSAIAMLRVARDRLIQPS